MISKWVVFATALLLALSSASSIVYAAPVLTPAQTDTHGPRMYSLKFSVITGDTALKGALLGGSIQAAEWTFIVSSYNSMAASSTVSKGANVGYTTDGIAFNTLRPYINSLDFRIAMEYLTNYVFLQSLVLQGIDGSASPYMLPCTLYTGACWAGAPTYVYNLADAANYLLKSGLVIRLIDGSFHCTVKNNLGTSGCTPGFTISSSSASPDYYGKIVGWYRHENPSKLIYTNPGHITSPTQSKSYGATSTAPSPYTSYTEIYLPMTNGKDCSTSIASWTGTNPGSACLFTPLFYYRFDDALRSGAAKQLDSAAGMIGFTFNFVGEIGKEYPPSDAAVISGGTYTPGCHFTSTGVGAAPLGATETGCNTMPQFDSTAVNSTTPATVRDNWDMFTYTWALSPAYVFNGEFFNSQFVGTSTSQFIETLTNFVNFYNIQMDHDSDALLYAPTLGVMGAYCPSATTCNANTAAKATAIDALKMLPYLPSFYKSTLWATYNKYWGGFSNIGSTGPSTGMGIFYTALNACPDNSMGCSHGVTPGPLQNCPHGLGTCEFSYALHQAADFSGMNPLYSSNWVWQADIWSSIYDVPLGVAPMNSRVTNAFMNWMTTSHSAAPFAGNTGSGPGWTDFQCLATPGSAHHNPTLCNTAQTIANGEAITFNFRQNMTWSDGFPVTAADYNYSIYVEDLAGSPTLPDAVTPFASTMAGPAGLIADHCTAYSCTMYVGSYNVWNVGLLNDIVLPQHLLSYLNPDLIATGIGAIDLTKTYSAAIAGCVNSGAAIPPLPQTCWNQDMNAAHTNSPPAWVLAEPNLEVGNSAFWMKSYNGITGAGELVANPYYHRSAWWVNATANSVSQTAASIKIGIPRVRLYTSTGWQVPGGVTFTSLACKSPGAGAVLDYSITYKPCTLTALPAGVTVGGYACASGKCSVTLSRTSGRFRAAHWEIEVIAHFTYLGQARTLTTFTGFTT